jgi:hypothetical protein
VAVSGVVQDPSTYSVSGTTLTFSGAPPSGSSNISVRFLGIPASGVATTAYRTLTTFTATSGQTTFSVPSYTVGYIDVYRNGVKLGTADFTATSGTTVVLASGATAGDLVETVSFFVSSVLNAIPAVANAVTTSYINDGAVTAAKMAASGAWAPAGTVLQVVNAQSTTPTAVNNSTTFSSLSLSASITPTSATSKILVLLSVTGLSTNAAIVGVKIQRNGSDIRTYGFVAHLNSATSMAHTNGMNYLDSPASTSALTYSVLGNSSQGLTTFQYSDGNGTQVSSITLMEIAG